jgi:hypothetical protein
MKNKTIYIIIGSVAVLGIAYYLWNKNRKNGDLKSSEIGTDTIVEEDKKKTEISETKTEEKEPVKTIKISKEEFEMKLQSACGKKPLLKRNKVLYNECRQKNTEKLISQGFTSFVGDYEGVVSEEFFNQFDNSWDINL